VVELSKNTTKKSIVWEAKLVTHRGELRIAVYFEKNAVLNERIKKITDARWSNTLKAWHVPDTEENRSRFKLASAIVLNEEHLKKIEQFNRWLSSKRYSESTVKVYCDSLKAFLKYYNNKSIEEINNEHVLNFNNDYIIKKKLSSSYQNQIVNALKLFFKQIVRAEIQVEQIDRPKREKLLPNVLSKEEIKKILEAPSNIKHKAMLSLIYSCGLRRGELLNMKITDIDAQRNLIIIRQAKGKKDRIVPLSQKMLDLLRIYYKSENPKNYLFEGQFGGKYSEKSLESVLKQALEKAKLKKPVSLHWLRHSYATHLLENGTDLRYIQEILGHNSSKTTEIYTHVSTKSIQNIKSPFDDL